MIARIFLTPRDVFIIAFIFDYGGVTLDQIRRRFFPTSLSHSPCSERIAILVKAGYLRTQRLPSQSGVGSGKAFLTVAPQARRLLAQAAGATASELQRIRLASPTFIRHHLAVADLRLSIELATASSPLLALEEWIPEGELRRSPIRVPDPVSGRSIPLIPDGAFILALPDGALQNFYLEVDLGTVAPKRLRVKLRGYLTRPSDPVPVLFVTSDVHRQQAVADWTAQEARGLSADPTIIWLTTMERANERTILTDPIWQVVGGTTLALIQSASNVAPAKPTTMLASGTITFGRRTTF